MTLKTNPKSWAPLAPAGLSAAWANLGSKIAAAREAAEAAKEAADGADKEEEKKADFDKGAGRILQRAPAWVIGFVATGRAQLAKANGAASGEEEGEGDHEGQHRIYEFNVGVGGDKIGGFSGEAWSGDSMLAATGFGPVDHAPGLDAEIIFP